MWVKICIVYILEALKLLFIRFGYAFVFFFNFLSHYSPISIL